MKISDHFFQYSDSVLFITVCVFVFSGGSGNDIFDQGCFRNIAPQQSTVVYTLKNPKSLRGSGIFSKKKKNHERAIHSVRIPRNIFFLLNSNFSRTSFNIDLEIRLTHCENSHCNNNKLKKELLFSSKSIIKCAIIIFLLIIVIIK